MQAMSNRLEIFKAIDEFLKDSWAILGIGNTLRGDDGFGSVVAQRLKDRIKSASSVERILDGGIAPENYLGKIRNMEVKKLLAIDAVIFGNSPGATNIFSPRELDSPTMFTHGPSNFEMMQLALPDTTILILATCPKSNHLGDSISQPVAKAIEVLVNEITKIVEAVG